jgi:hypothetical protein
MTPPDVQAEVDRLKYRCHVAEVLVYKMEEMLVHQLSILQPLVRQMHELNKQYPLGDSSVGDAADIAVNAVKHLPQFSGLTPSEIMNKLSGKG